MINRLIRRFNESSGKLEFLGAIGMLVIVIFALGLGTYELFRLLFAWSL